MADIQLINPTSGQVFNVDESQAKAAAESHGLEPATPEQVAAYDLQKKSGGFMDQVANIPAEAGRVVASSAAAAVRGLSSLGGEVDAMGNPTETTAPVSDLKGSDLAPALYTQGMLDRRAANPISTVIGGAIPAVATAVAAPELGIAGMLGLDYATAAAQEATDAELEKRDISAQNVMRNGSYNALFSLGLTGAGSAVKAVLGATEDAVKGSLKVAIDKAEEYGLPKVRQRTAEALNDVDQALDNMKAPKVDSNPNAQRDAIENLADSYIKDNQELSSKLMDFHGVSGDKRFQGLQELAASLDGEEAASVTELLQNRSLWGDKAVDFVSGKEAAASLRPASVDDLAGLSSYAESFRKLGGSKLADILDERAQQLAISPLADKVASVAPEVANVAAKVTGRGVGTAIGHFPGYFIGKEISDTLGSAAKNYAKEAGPAIKEGFINAVQALKTYAENDQRITARLLVDPESSAKFIRILGTTPSTIERFQADDSTAEQALQRHRDLLDKYLRDPSALADKMDQTMNGLDNQSPALHRQAAVQAIAVTQFLKSKMPPRRGVSVARPNGTPASPLETRTYALYATAALDPGSVMQDARVGKLRKEQLEALSTLWPTEYTGLRNAVIEQMGNGSTTVVRQRMNLLFGFGNSIDPALGPKITAMVTAARQAKGAGGGTSGGSSPGISSQTPPSLRSLTPAGSSSMQLLSGPGR